MKTVTKIVLATTIMAFYIVPVSAQTAVADKPVQKAAVASTFTPGTFSDTNKNGVCDNFEARPKSGRGGAFIDKNGDGICDNRGTFGRGQGKGNGKGQGQGFQNNPGKGNYCGRGNGCGRGYRNAQRNTN